MPQQGDTEPQPNTIPQSSVDVDTTASGAQGSGVANTGGVRSGKIMQPLKKRDAKYVLWSFFKWDIILTFLMWRPGAFVPTIGARTIPRELSRNSTATGTQSRIPQWRMWVDSYTLRIHFHWYSLFTSALYPQKHHQLVGPRENRAMRSLNSGWCCVRSRTFSCWYLCRSTCRCISLHI